MTNWMKEYRSFYYMEAPEPENPILKASETVLLTIDIQNIYMEEKKDSEEQKQWAPFLKRMNEIVIPNVKNLQEEFRSKGIDVLHARIACLLEDGRDRSLSQKKPGWNYLLLPCNETESKIVSEIAPKNGEIEITKTTDSALTGTNLRLILSNMGVKNVVLTGIFTDQCISSTVRSLADESFNVILIEDGCAAGTEELHLQELNILNMIYCNVMSSKDVLNYIS